MDVTMDAGINKRVVTLLGKSGITPPSDFEVTVNQIRKFRSISDKSPSREYWIYVSFKENLLIFFGELDDGKNYSYCSSIGIDITGHVWILIIREREVARRLREKLKGNSTYVSKGNNIWIAAAGNDNVIH